MAHALAEDVATGLLAGTHNDVDARALLESAWERHLSARRVDLEQTWAPASPPPPQDWPGYQLTKTRVINGLLRTRWSDAETGAQLGLRPLTIEQTLEDPVTGLRGRPDRIEEGPEGTCVVEVKSGLTQAAPRPAQRRQLLIYAHLVASAGRPLPTKMAVQDATGQRWEEAVEPLEVATVVADVQHRRAAFNRVMDGVEDLQALAEPAEETCRHCPFRVVCSPYWSTVETAWAHGAVAGGVLERHPTAAGATVALIAESPVDTVGERWTISAVPAEAVVHVGQQACIVDAETTRGERHLRWRWYTRIETC